jgi:lectin, mannose-binding 1
MELSNMPKNVGRVVVALLLFLVSALAVKEVSEFSLPNLITVNSLEDISSSWTHHGDTIYNEGRIILTPKPSHISANEKEMQYGSLWSTSRSSNKLESFTLELTLRSLGSYGFTDAGLSLFLVDARSANLEDSSNFGGPEQFTGLQLLLNMDNTLGPVIRAYLNDGKKLNLNKDYLGAYKYEYQSSNVPVTLKIAYDSATKFFKVTCDNKLLFQTDKINLSNLLQSDLMMGITAKSQKNYEKHEQFELLRFISYDSVTPDMREDEDETLVAQHALSQGQGQQGQKPDIKKFREQQERLRQQLAAQVSHLGGQGESSTQLSHEDTSAELSSLKSSIDMILSILERNDQTVIQQQLHQLTKSLDRVASNFAAFHDQFTTLNNNYNDLSNMFKRQFDLLDNYDTTLRSFDKVLQHQLQTSNNLDTRLSTISNTMNSEKLNPNKVDQDDSYGKIKSLLYLIFLPVLVLLALVVFWVHRLRTDIKHAKVL